MPPATLVTRHTPVKSGPNALVLHFHLPHEERQEVKVFLKLTASYVGEHLPGVLELNVSTMTSGTFCGPLL